MTLILCLDGLDLTLIQRWGCDNLLLNEHGLIDVPISQRYRLPHSPDVWASFLTGRWYQNLRFVRPYGTHHILNAMYWLRKKAGTSFGLARLGERIYAKTVNQFPSLHVDVNVEAYNMPFINYDGAGLTILQGFQTHHQSRKDTYNLLMDLYEQRKCDASMLCAPLMFFEFPDMAQHFITKSELWKIRDLYCDLEQFVTELQPDLIIADHGFDPTTGLHTTQGLYASQSPLDPKPLAITDLTPYLYPKITSQIP
jgi:hypothetical protein